LLAAVGAKTSRIEIGTAVIDMRYENPLYMIEDAGAADLIAGGRLQLGISRGSPEQVIEGWRYFGYQPADGQTDADMGRRHAEVFLDLLRGEGFAQPNPQPGKEAHPRYVAARPIEALYQPEMHGITAIREYHRNSSACSLCCQCRLHAA
jgi:alkanesulfonate monooxygenase SsuD/methylene tetrahydromethanopterin reductase-like flavin-dependent oxidoreductase (luciferase family)